MIELSIDNIPDINNGSCFYCGKVLTEKNISAWIVFNMVNGEQVGVNQCLICCEAHSRMFVGAKKEGDSIAPVKTYEQCLREMETEGITEDILKQIEDAQFETRQ